MPPPDCATELGKIYDAIMALGTGQQATSVSFNGRSVSYGPSQLPQLQRLYQMFWRTCGADAGYPNLSQPVERGLPAVYRGFPGDCE